MLTPTNEKTAKLFSPLGLIDSDRLAISLITEKPKYKTVIDEDGDEKEVLIEDEHSGDKFIISIYGKSITKEEYHNNNKWSYRCCANPKNPSEQIYYTLPSSAALRDFIQRIPERKQVHDGSNFRGEKYEVAATDITVSLIYKLWMEKPSDYDANNNGHYVADRVAFKDDETKAVFFYLLHQAAKQNHNIKVISQYKNNKSVPEEGFEDFQYAAERPLSPYQQVAAYLQFTNESFGLFMEQGTGKTPPTIANIDNLALKHYNLQTKELEEGKIKHRTMFKALILCPNNVRANWEKEINNFSTVDNRVTIIRGTGMDRIRAVYDAFINFTTEKYSAIICGYDTVYRVELLMKMKWDLIVADEAHYFKSPDTKRWKDGMRKLRENSKRRYVLTGTPVCNSIIDLWTQLEFLRKGGSGFNSFHNFRDFYSVYDEWSRRVGYQNLPFIQERLAQVSFFISKKEALPDLPEKVYDIVEVEMSPHQEDVYNKVASQLHYEIERDLQDSSKNDSMTINNILTKLLRLAQITSGFQVFDAKIADDGTILQPKLIERFKEQPKLDALLELLQARQPNEKTIVWAHWREDSAAIEELCESHGISCVVFNGSTSEKQRLDAEYLFNNDDSVTVFIGSAAAGGTGLNLLGYPPQEPEKSECNVTQEIFFSQSWSYMHRSQAEDRAHRRGTRTNVRITDLQVPETIDTEIRARVVDKKNTAIEIADLREILNSVIGRI